MCKIMAIPGVASDKKEQVKRFVKTARHFLTQVDKDGFGYAEVSEKGLRVERWLKPKHAFTGPKKNVRYSSFGESGEHFFSILAHSRLATCGKEIENVHPFVRGETALIHNGVIWNADDLQLLQSTCDSEAILNEYVDSNVTENPHKIQEVTGKLMGWFACAVLTKNSKHGWVIDVFKDEGTPLYYSFIEELNAPVICTSEEVIKLSARLLRFTVKDIFRIPPLSFMRFDAASGVVLEWFNFTPQKPKGVALSKGKREWDDKAYDRYWQRREYKRKDPIQEAVDRTVEKSKTILRKAIKACGVPPEKEPVPSHKEPLKLVSGSTGSATSQYPNRWTPQGEA